MKTREEVVNGIIARFGSEVGHIYDNAYRSGMKQGTASLAAEKALSFQEGYDRCLSENSFDTPCPSCSREEYERGLNDAWETAKALHRVWTFDCFGDANEFDRLLDLDCDPGENVILKFFSKFTAKEAAEKLRHYEKQTEIARGDEVEALDTGKWVRFIVWKNECGFVTGVDERGGHYEYPTNACRKTGKHFDISFSEANRP